MHLQICYSGHSYFDLEKGTALDFPNSICAFHPLKNITFRNMALTHSIPPAKPYILLSNFKTGFALGPIKKTIGDLL
jgi:hypothetical protein